MNNVKKIYKKINSSNNKSFISKILITRQISRLNSEEYAKLMSLCFESDFINTLYRLRKYF